VEVITDLLPVKRGDPGHTVIPISIGMVNFLEALCDFASSINIMPRFPKEILKNLRIRVGTLYAPADFMVIETGTDERAPIILGRPFLNTSGAVIYASAAKFSFYIKGKKETFSFKNKTTQISEHSRQEPRKGPTGGTETSKCGSSQLRWLLQFKEVKIVDLSHHP